MTDRGSSQHSPRVDDELAHETEDIVRSTHESRVEEWRMTEPPADGEPMPDTMPYEDEIEFRSLLATSLRPSAFPCRRARLLGVAEEEYAPARVVVALRALPAEQEFHNVEEVWEALGGHREERQHEEHQHDEHQHDEINTRCAWKHRRLRRPRHRNPLSPNRPA